MFVAVLRYVLMAVEILCSILLIGIILIQRTRGQGVGGLAFGVGMGESLFGAQAGNVLTKITVILAVVFLVNTTILAMIRVVPEDESVSDKIGDVANVPMAPAVPTVPQQAAPTPTAPREAAVQQEAPSVSVTLPPERSPAVSAVTPQEAPSVSVTIPQKSPDKPAVEQKTDEQTVE